MIVPSRNLKISVNRKHASYHNLSRPKPQLRAFAGLRRRGGASPFRLQRLDGGVLITKLVTGTCTESLLMSAIHVHNFTYISLTIPDPLAHQTTSTML